MAELKPMAPKPGTGTSVPPNGSVFVILLRGAMYGKLDNFPFTGCDNYSLSIAADTPLLYFSAVQLRQRERGMTWACLV